MHDFCIVDVIRAAGFSWLGSWPRPFPQATLGVDVDGRSLAVIETNAGRFAVALPSPADGNGQAVSSSEHEAAVKCLGSGDTLERMLWAIHCEVLRTKCSRVDIPELYLADLVWGLKARPKNWRRELKRRLATLKRLHFLPLSEADRPFDFASQMLVSLRELKGTAANACGSQCIWSCRPRHNHFRINIGGGFLGVLEQFAEERNDSVRHYRFPNASRDRRVETLTTIGRAGGIGQLYLPAKLGDHQACDSFTAAQRRLLQALVHETTRDGSVRGESRAAISVGRVVVVAYPRKSLECPLLRADASYVGFNGNKLRKGMGYLMRSAGGWQHKAGYGLEDTRKFLTDLGVLRDRLNVIPVGFAPDTRTFMSLDRMVALSASDHGLRVVERLHLRVYAPDDYLGRWRQVFGRSPASSQAESRVATDDHFVVAALGRRGMKAGLSKALGIDPAFLSKLLSGKKSWPKGVFEQVVTWLQDASGTESHPIGDGILAGQ